MSKPRGLMLIHNFRPLPVGGAEIQAERLAAKMVELEHPMEILTQQKIADAPLEEVANGVTIRRALYEFPYRFYGNQSGLFRELIRRRNSYDILHAHMAFGHAVVAVVAAKFLGKRAIVKIACAGEFGDLAVIAQFPFYEQAINVLRQADAMVAVSKEVQKELLDAGFLAGRIVQIPNGVDTEYHQPNTPASRDEKVRFLLIGRRHPQKGIDSVIEATRILKDKGLAEQFQVVSYGADYAEYDYRSLAMSKGVANLVEFKSYERDLVPVYLSGHCLLLPSRGEGLSNALLEAMSMELPVIASRVSGTADVIESEKDGILIEPDSPMALADAMSRLIQDREKYRRMGHLARLKVVSQYSLENTARQYSWLYNDLCNQGTTRG